MILFAYEKDWAIFILWCLVCRGRCTVLCGFGLHSTVPGARCTGLHRRVLVHGGCKGAWPSDRGRR